MTFWQVLALLWYHVGGFQVTGQNAAVDWGADQCVFRDQLDADEETRLAFQDKILKYDEERYHPTLLIRAATRKRAETTGEVPLLNEVEYMDACRKVPLTWSLDIDCTVPIQMVHKDQLETAPAEQVQDGVAQVCADD